MFISRGHFLASYAVALTEGSTVSNVVAIDTDLMVAQRLMGYDPNNGAEITDLVKVDEVVFISNGMPENLKALVPEGFRLLTAEVRSPEDSE